MNEVGRPSSHARRIARHRQQRVTATGAIMGSDARDVHTPGALGVLRICASMHTVSDLPTCARVRGSLALVPAACLRVTPHACSAHVSAPLLVAQASSLRFVHPSDCSGCGSSCQLVCRTADGRRPTRKCAPLKPPAGRGALTCALQARSLAHARLPGPWLDARIVSTPGAACWLPPRSRTML